MPVSATSWPKGSRPADAATLAIEFGQGAEHLTRRRAREPRSSGSSIARRRAEKSPLHSADRQIESSVRSHRLDRRASCQVRIKACCSTGSWSCSSLLSFSSRSTSSSAMASPSARTIGPRIASSRWSRVSDGTRNWLAVTASGRPWKRAQSPMKSERMVSTTRMGGSGRGRPPAGAARTRGLLAPVGPRTRRCPAGLGKAEQLLELVDEDRAASCRGRGHSRRASTGRRRIGASTKSRRSRRAAGTARTASRRLGASPASASASRAIGASPGRSSHQRQVRRPPRRSPWRAAASSPARTKRGLAAARAADDGDQPGAVEQAVERQGLLVAAEEPVVVGLGVGAQAGKGPVGTEREVTAGAAAGAGVGRACRACHRVSSPRRR